MASPGGRTALSCHPVAVGQPRSPQGMLPPTQAAADWIKGRRIQAGPIKPLPWGVKVWRVRGGRRESVCGLSGCLDQCTASQVLCRERTRLTEGKWGEKEGDRRALRS